MSDAMTIDKLNGAIALIKALAPKEAPPDCNIVFGTTGLKIFKNVHLPDDSIMVSKRLFDLIYEESTQEQQT